MGHFIVVNAGVNPRVPLSHALRECFLGLWKKLSVGNRWVRRIGARPTVGNLVKFESFSTVFCPKSVSLLSHVPVSQEKIVGEQLEIGGRTVTTGHTPYRSCFRLFAGVLSSAFRRRPGRG